MACRNLRNTPRIYNFLAVILISPVLLLNLFGCGREHEDDGVAAQVTITQKQNVQIETATPEVIVQTVTLEYKTDYETFLEDFIREWYSKGVEYGEAFNEGGDEILISVNGQLITTGDFLEQKARYFASIEMALQDADMVYPALARQRISAASEAAKKYGNDLWILLKIVRLYTAFDAATEQGYSVADDEISRQVSDIRTDFATRLSDSSFLTNIEEELRGYISVVGSEKYWSTILPARLRVAHVVDQWVTDIDLKLGVGAGERALHDVAQAAIRNGEIEVYGLFAKATGPVERNEMLIAGNDDMLTIWEGFPPHKQEMSIEK